MEERKSLRRELGLIPATAFVIGNTIGSGIFMAPQGLAAVASPAASMLAWVITSAGSILLAISFMRLGRAIPLTGGPVVYTRRAFGDFAAFLVAWTYWIGIWVGDAAIITASVSYLAYFIPQLASDRLLAFLASTGILWVFTLINLKGIKEAGVVSVVTTVGKVIPLLIFAGVAIFHFNPENFQTTSSPELSGLSGLSIAVSITLWSFLGLESATLPAEEIKDPEKNIPRSTILGILFCALVYLLISGLAIGAMPQEKLAVTQSPLAEIIDYVTGGNWGGTLIALGALVSTLGTISGWIMVTARCSYGAAQDQLFPSFFTRVHPRFQVPHVALLISSLGTNLILITNYVKTLTAAFNFILLLSTLSILPVYAFTAAADMMLLTKRDRDFSFTHFLKNSFLALLAFVYSLYAIFGSGASVVMYGFLLLLAGIPVYIFQKLRNTAAEPVSKLPLGAVDGLRETR